MNSYINAVRLHYLWLMGCVSALPSGLLQDLWPHKHEDVVDDLVDGADQEVGAEGAAEGPEERGLACLLRRLHQQDLRLFQGPRILLVPEGPPRRALGGVERLL